ncbi:unnamed protein product, partial [Phaeothamnion confervicola]
ERRRRRRQWVRLTAAHVIQRALRRRRAARTEALALAAIDKVLALIVATAAAAGLRERNDAADIVTRAVTRAAIVNRLKADPIVTGSGMFGGGGSGCNRQNMGMVLGLSVRGAFTSA